MTKTNQAPLQTAPVDLPESQTRNDSLKSIVRLGDTLKYDFAYSVIYLRPNDPVRALALQERFSNQDVVAVDIDLSDNAPANIELNCDTLLLVGGERYKGASKNLTLRCRRLQFKDGLGDDATELSKVTFDLSGVNSKALAAEAAEHATNPNPTALDAQKRSLEVVRKTNPQYFFTGMAFGNTNVRQSELEWYEPVYADNVIAAKPGINAKTIAKPGKPGRNGGNFTLYASLIDQHMLKADSPPISIISNGSDGGPGQDGGNGTKGGDGVDWPCEINAIRFNEHEISSLRKASDLFEGGAGGKGGFGGPGGRGGSGGNVSVTCGDKLDITSGLIALNSTVGKDGAYGKNGNPGARGGVSKSGFFKPHDPEGWERLAYILHKDDPYKEKVEHIARRATYLPNTPAPEQITNAQRWEKLAENERQPTPSQGTSIMKFNQHQEMSSTFGTRPLLLVMLIQRLHFEHFVYFTAQAYPDPRTKGLEWLRQGQDDFRILYDWLDSIIEAWRQAAKSDNTPGVTSSINTTTGFTALQKAVHDQFGLLSCKACAAPVMDPFKHSIKYVPFIPSKAVYRSIRDDYKIAEGSFKSLADVLETKQKDRQAAAGNLNQATQKINACVSRITSETISLGEIETQFGVAQKNLDDHLEKMKQDLEDVKEALRKHLECTGERICEALSTVLMFGSGEPASDAGAALSLGLSAYQTRDEAVNTIGGVRKELLYGRLEFMSTTEDDLRKDIGKSLEDMRRSGAASSEYRQQIVANKAAFENLCSEVLHKINASKNLRDRYRQVIKAIDRRDKVVADYNRAFVTIAEQRMVIEGQEEAIEDIKSASSNLLTDDEVQVVARFSSRIHSDIAKFALWAIWGRARAYNCVSFHMSRIYEFMSNLSLHSFSSLTAERLDQLDTIMNEDLVLLSEEWSRNRKARDNVTLTLDEENCAFLLGALRDSKDKSFELDIDHDFFYEYSDFEDEDAYDFRLYSMAVYLHGARSKKSLTQGLQKGLEDQIRLHIYNHGQNRYRYPLPKEKKGKSDAWVEDMFEFAPVSTPFKYKYIVDEDECVAPVDSYCASEELALDIDGHPDHKPIPLKSPLSYWTIKAADFVDVTKVQKIKIIFEVTYRIRDPKKH